MMRRNETNALGRVNEFSDLKHGSPHCATTTSNGSLPFAIIEELVWNNSATQAKQPKTNATDN
jgi:hypothetical protein